MTRVLLAAVVLAAFPPNSRAEEAAVRLTVRPMPAPKPALKYQLLPELGELNPGNAAQDYLKCFMEQRNFFFSKEAVAERARYLTMPLAELPADKLKRVRRRRRSGRPTGRPGWIPLDWQYPQRSPGRRHGDCCRPSWGRSRSWRRRSRSGSVPRWPGGASTTRSAPPRRCSRWPATWASTPRRSRTWSGCGSRT